MIRLVEGVYNRNVLRMYVHALIYECICCMYSAHYTCYLFIYLQVVGTVHCTSLQITDYSIMTWVIGSFILFIFYFLFSLFGVVLSFVVLYNGDQPPVSVIGYSSSGTLTTGKRRRCPCKAWCTHHAPSLLSKGLVNLDFFFNRC